MDFPLKISATIIAYNEATQIAACINSLLSVVDEIIVVDDFSTDRTKEISEKLGATVIQNKFIDFEQQKNFADSICTYYWILNLDADEMLSTTLQKSILNFKKNPIANACKMNRLNFVGNDAVKVCDWYPDKKLRLYKKNISSWTGGPVHAYVKTNIRRSEIVHLKGDIIHNAYKNKTDIVNRFEKYAKTIAADRKQKGVKYNFVKCYTKPLVSFLYLFTIKLGFTDFKYGFFLSKEIAYERHLREKFLKTN